MGATPIEAAVHRFEMPGTMNGLDLAAASARWSAIAVLVTSGRVHPGAGMLPVGVDFSQPFFPRSDRQNEGPLVADHHE
jgi:hypothetical protein